MNNYFEKFNEVSGMDNGDVKAKYDCEKESILKFLFVEMKEEVLNTDVKSLFKTKKTTVAKNGTSNKKEMTPEQKAKKTVYGRLFNQAKKEIKERKDKGEELTAEQEKEIKDLHLSILDEEVEKELNK